MIHLDNIQFGYGKEKLFDALSLRLNAGTVYGLLGENGAGKTSLLKMVSGLVFPKSGQCRVLEHEPRQRQPSLMRQLYFVADDPYLPTTTARKFAEIYGVFYEKFDTPLFIHYLSELQVLPDQKLEKMSFGQRKKTVIAFALATNVPLLLMDEPTNGLDIPSKSVFRKLVAGAMTPDRCIVISTHQVRDLDTLIDNVLVLHKGRIVYQENLNKLAEASDSQPNLEELFQTITLQKP